MGLTVMQVHNDLQDHKKDDILIHGEVLDTRKDIRDIKENHLAHIQASMAKIETNVDWLMKFFWVLVPSLLGILVKVIFFK